MSQFKRNILESRMQKLITNSIPSLRDEEIQGKMISVTRVKLSRDKSYIDLYVSCLNGDLDEITEILNARAGFFRKKLADNIRMYKVPEVRFHKDIGLEESFKIQKILNKIDIQAGEDEE